MPSSAPKNGAREGILAGIDEIQQELDDQIVKTQALTQRDART